MRNEFDAAANSGAMSLKPCLRNTQGGANDGGKQAIRWDAFVNSLR
jgi:hypothetical protein